MENLKEYQLPKQKVFSAKNGNELYQRITRILKDPKTEIYMSFLYFIAQSLNCFLTPVQTSSPIIHRFYLKILEWIHNLLGKVIKDKLLMINGRPVSAKK